MELSNRLHMVASMVEKGSIPADVGCDHGYVAVYLIREGVCPRVFAMDVNEGPLERAREHVEEFGLAAYIAVRLSDGISGLPCRGGRPEADTLLAAGMGGRLMVKIMEEGREKLAQMRWAILQPQSEAWLVREALKKNGYFITEENMIWEEGKFYTVIKAVNLQNPPEGFCQKTLEAQEKRFLEECKSQGLLSSDEWERAADIFGSRLILEKNPVLLEYLKESLRKNRQISAGIDSASAGEAGAPEKEKTAGRLAQLAKEGQLLEQLIGIMK